MTPADALAACRIYPDRAATFLHLPESAPTTGIPLAVKDNIDVAGMPTTAGCPGFAYQPTEDAAVVARLRAAGYVPVAKTALDQFATGLVGTRSPHGVPVNPVVPGKIPGGSSSGSACAVSAGLVPVALGTDTAGSGRVPAAFQGLVGLKPTKGWWSTRGVVPAVRSLDCISVFARTVAEAWAVAEIAGGFDPADPFSRVKPEVTLPVGSLRIGVLAEDELTAVALPQRAAYDQAQVYLRGLGHTLVPIDFTPFREAAGLLYGGAWVAERTAAVGAAVAAGVAGLDPTVAGIIAGGHRFTAVQAWQGTYDLARLRRAADFQWQAMDVLLLPTVTDHPTPAEVAADPVGVNSRMGRFTNFANLLDTCALAVPITPTPAGITLFAPAWHDLLLARLGAALQDAAFSRPQPQVIPGDDGGLELAVFGAHRQGFPLHAQLLGFGARFVGPCRTAPVYRVYRLSGKVARPALVHGGDGAFSGELYRLPAAGVGRLLATIAPPLGLGTVELEGGYLVKGFIAEGRAALGAEDITAWGAWR